MEMIKLKPLKDNEDVELTPQQKVNVHALKLVERIEKEQFVGRDQDRFIRVNYIYLDVSELKDSLQKIGLIAPTIPKGESSDSLKN